MIQDQSPAHSTRIVLTKTSVRSCILVAVFLLSGCNSPCTAGPSPTLEIGLGQEVFQPIAGAEGSVVFGPQGGCHIDLALRFTHLDIDELLSGTFRATLDTLEVAHGNPWFVAECNEEYEVATGLRLLLDVPPSEIEAQTLLLDVTIQDSREATISRTIDLQMGIF